jgi:hypothetical protein
MSKITQGVIYWAISRSRVTLNNDSGFFSGVDVMITFFCEKIGVFSQNPT